MAEIMLVPVASSNLTAVGYSQEENTLRVQFINGTTYEYEGVSADEYYGLLNASSVGQYFNQNIKGMYTGKRVA